MIRIALVIAFSGAVAAALGSQASAIPRANIAICGQIKHGPHDSWSFPAAVASALGVPPTVSGTTWTVIADASTLCGLALKSTPALLIQWAKTTRGQIHSGIAGLVCAKSIGYVGSGGKGSPGGTCLKKGLAFSFIESGPYSLAQVKQLAATGKLPH
jgi:hypothetical protein